MNKCDVQCPHAIVDVIDEYGGRIYLRVLGCMEDKKPETCGYLPPTNVKKREDSSTITLPF